MDSERILVTVRTYPNISERYQETVCTGGINDRGEWRRLYPVQLRHLEPERQYRTYDIITVKVGDNPDGRPESRRPDLATLRVSGRVDGWQERCDWILPTAFESLAEMREEGRTLAPVRVERVIDFVVNPEEPEWNERQKQILQQQGLFDGPKPLEKVPFEFRLRWLDGDSAEHDSKFIAWEVGETWRAYRFRYDNPIERMREVWMNERFASRGGVWFFMGNFAAHRQVFGVCGTFSPPEMRMTSDTLW